MSFSDLTKSAVAAAVSEKTPGDPTTAYASIPSPYSADQAVLDGEAYATDSIIGDPTGLISIPLLAGGAINGATCLLGKRTIIGCVHHVSTSQTSITFRTSTGLVTVGLATLTAVEGYTLSANGKWHLAPNDICVAHLSADAPAEVLASPLKIFDGDFGCYLDFANAPLAYSQIKLPGSPTAYWAIGKLGVEGDSVFADTTYADWRRPDYLASDNTPAQSGTPIVALVNDDLVALGHASWASLGGVRFSPLSDNLTALQALGYSTDIADSLYDNMWIFNDVPNYAITATIDGVTETTLAVWDGENSAYIGTRADTYVVALVPGPINVDAAVFNNSTFEKSKYASDAVRTRARLTASTFTGDAEIPEVSAFSAVPYGVVTTGTLTLGSETAAVGGLVSGQVNLAGPMPGGTLTLDDGEEGEFSPSTSVLGNETYVTFYYTPTVAGTLSLAASLAFPFTTSTLTGTPTITVAPAEFDAANTGNTYTVQAAVTINEVAENVTLTISSVGWEGVSSDGFRLLLLNNPDPPNEWDLYVLPPGQALDFDNWATLPWWKLVTDFDGVSGGPDGDWTVNDGMIGTIAGGTITPLYATMPISLTKDGDDLSLVASCAGAVGMRYQVTTNGVAGEWVVVWETSLDVTLEGLAASRVSVVVQALTGVGNIFSQGTATWGVGGGAAKLSSGSMAAIQMMQSFMEF